MGRENRWKCSFLDTEGVIEEIETPTFFSVYLYDFIQLRNDGISNKNVRKFTEGEKQWAVMRKDQIVERIEKLRSPKHGIYAINCYYHGVSRQDSQVTQISVLGKTLSQSFQEWLEGKPVELVDDQCGDTIACNPRCPPVTW